MKTVAVAGTLLAACTVIQAQEVGQVLSRTAVYQQVAVPRQTCVQAVTPHAPTSGAGAVSGALTGAVLGTLIGEGSGAGALLGAVGGAIVGDRMEGNSYRQPVTTCSTQTVMENRLVGYNVVYEYAGKTYNVQLPQDPGPTIALQITPAGLQTATPVAPPPVTVVTPPAVVYSTPPVVYAPAPYYRPWPVNTSVHLGWGWYGGGHRHWR